MDRVMITINTSLLTKPRAVWRNVNKDRNGEYVIIDRDKKYLSELKRTGEFEYRITE